MPLLLQRLLEQPLISIDKIGLEKVPQKGVYIFFEGKKAIYVGRSNRLKNRLKEHSQKSSDHYSATLAFRIAKHETTDIQKKGRKQTNEQLMSNRNFLKEFNDAKERISKTKIRFIEVEDPIEQTLFEVYAYLELNTKYNDFGTH